MPLIAADEPPGSVSFREEAADAAQAQRGAGRMLEMEFANRPDKVIAAYAVRVEHREPGLEEPAAVEVPGTLTRAPGLGKGRPGYAPGDRWTERAAVRAVSHEPAISLDLVVYEDGSHWGPDKSKRLDRPLGIRAGASIERQR